MQEADQTKDAEHAQNTHNAINGIALAGAANATNGVASATNTAHRAGPQMSSQQTA